MEYVEILRVRRVLFWFAVALLATIALNVLSIAFGGHVQINGGPPRIPLSALLVGCGMVAYILMSCIAPGLSAEGATIAISWTRPSPRDTVAWRYVAVDAITILAGYAVFIAAAFVLFALFRAMGLIAVDADAPRVLVLVLGTCFMWYGLILAASTRFPGRGSMVAGLSWVAFLLLGVLPHLSLPWLLHDIVVALNYLNPLAYISGAGKSDQGSNVLAVHGIWRLILPWLIGAAATIAGVRLWSTREV